MNRFLLPGLIGWMLLVPLVSGVQAVDATTPTVKGRAPVASNVVITNQTRPGDQARVRDALQVNYNFKDLDGDGDAGTTSEWRRGSANTGTGARIYTPVGADVYQSLTVVVTPKTNSATSDPFSGAPVTSAAITVLPANIGRFIAPDTTKRNWTTANSYCQGLGRGARLPTRDELKQLLIDTQIPQSTFLICQWYGWPQSNSCQGQGNEYWTRDAFSSSVHYDFSMYSKESYGRLDAELKHVACIR